MMSLSDGGHERTLHAHVLRNTRGRDCGLSPVRVRVATTDLVVHIDGTPLCHSPPILAATDIVDREIGRILTSAVFVRHMAVGRW
jgi:hypothetical protein